MNVRINKKIQGFEQERKFPPNADTHYHVIIDKTIIPQHKVY